MADKLTEVLAAYGAAWGETDQARRDALLTVAWAETGTYQDPTGSAEGRAALSAHIAGVQGQLPGCRIELTSGIDQHHDKVRFGWQMRQADGAVVVGGTDFAALAPDGRIAMIVGFFGPLPEPA